ncbi:MAG: hypothetical protein R3F02_09225 [Thiolinea sp.]
MNLVSLQQGQVVPEHQETLPKEVTLGSWHNNWDAWVNKYIQPGIREGYFDLVVERLHDDIFHFPLFTREFCEEFIAYTEQNADWTKDRHQFYPTNDVLLTDLGLDRMYRRVLETFCHPVARMNWRLEGRRWMETMVDESFVARYRAEEQQSLAIHSDFSDYTFTVGLNVNFEGGGTWFPRQHVLANPRGGYCTLFPSMTHPHGGRPTIRGTRYILVSFCRRANLYVEN